MGLLDSEIDNIEKELALTDWSPSMDNIIDLLRAKRGLAATEARRPLQEALEQMFDMPTSDASDFINNCLERDRAVGHALIRHLTTFLEKTPK